MKLGKRVIFQGSIQTITCFPAFLHERGAYAQKHVVPYEVIQCQLGKLEVASQKADYIRLEVDDYLECDLNTRLQSK